MHASITIQFLDYEPESYGRTVTPDELADEIRAILTKHGATSLLIHVMPVVKCHADPNVLPAWRGL
jgi:hypothetical protein